MKNALMKSARESVDNGPDEGNIVNAPLFEDLDMTAPDVIFAKESHYASALESLIQDADRLEGVSNLLTETPAENLTPAVVEAATLSLQGLDEPVPAVESADGDDRSGVEKLKSFAGKSAEAAKKAAKAVLETILSMIDAVVAFFTDTRAGTEKKLAEFASKASSAPASAEIAFQRKYSPLLYGDSFDANSATECMKTYATLLAVSADTVDGVIGFNFFSRSTYNPAALRDMATRFETSLARAFTKEGDGFKVLSGHGGLDVTVNSSASVEVDNSDSEVSAVSTTFTRSDMAEMVKQARGLLQGVAKIEPAIKKTQASIRKMLLNDIFLVPKAMNVGSGRPMSFSGIFLIVRRYINFALKYGVGRCLKAAHAVGHITTAYLAGGSKATDEGGEGQSQAYGNIDHKLLAA